MGSISRAVRAKPASIDSDAWYTNEYIDPVLLLKVPHFILYPVEAHNLGVGRVVK
jgi:hypothetical protein